MASALCILILPEGTELFYVGVLLDMIPEGAEGAAVLCGTMQGHSLGSCSGLCAMPTLGPSTGANGVL